MALRTRLNNMGAYAHWPRAKAAFGLLTSDTRHEWIQTVGTCRLSETTLDKVYPWYAFSSIGYLKELITKDMNVLEYGGGYSTIWWASRVAQVSTVERSEDWSEEVKRALVKHRLTNVKLVCFDKLPDLSEEELSINYESLASLVNEYILSANVTAHSCDVVVVDDVYRNEVIKAAMNFVKPGGLLILDDSERERHAPVIEMLKGLHWSFASFHSTAPYHFHEKQTTIWFKPK